MDNEVIAGLQAQLNHERQNAQKYFYIASAFSNMAYNGFSSFFIKQGKGELEHAAWISEFLISKRVQPMYMVLDGIILPLDVVSLVKEALVTELRTTQSLKELYVVCEEGSEYQACSLLDKMLLEQIEEESWATDLVDLVSRTDPNGWVFLDIQYGSK
jgi:ferritin